MTCDQVSKYAAEQNQTARRLSPRSIHWFRQINNCDRNWKLTIKEIRIKICQCVSEIC